MALRNAFGDLGLDSTLQAIRDRLPAALGGTGGVKVDVGSSALPSGAATSANQTNGTQQTQITDGTNIGSVLKSDGTAAGQNAQITSGTGFTTGTINLSAGTPNTNWYDMLNYSWVSFEILSNASAATFSFQTSGDASQTNTTSSVMTNAGTTGAAGSVNTTSATATFHGPRTGRYFRISTNLSGGNTASLVLTFFTQTAAYNPGGVVGAKTNNNGTPNSTNLGVLPGVANAAQPSLNEGNQVLESMDLKGNQRTRIQDAAGNDRGANVNASNQLTTTDSASSATGSAVPSSASLTGASDGTNLQPLRTGVAGLNSTGSNVLSTGIAAQFDDTSPTAITENNWGNVRMSSNRNLYGTVRDAAGNERGANVNASNQLSVSVDNSPTFTAAVGSPAFVTTTPSTTGGWTPSLKNGLSNTNSQVKSGAGTLGGWYVYNPNSTATYLQIFDTATGSITVGTTTPKLSLAIPPLTGANIELTNGINFATAICVAATTAATNGTAPGTALDCNFWYK